jgi:hypothetical protein
VQPPKYQINVNNMEHLAAKDGSISTPSALQK